MQHTHRNDVVGWVVLAFLITFGILIVAGIGSAIDSTSTVTTHCDATYTTCTTSVR